MRFTFVFCCERFNNAINNTDNFLIQDNAILLHLESLVE